MFQGMIVSEDGLEGDRNKLGALVQAMSKLVVDDDESTDVVDLGLNISMVQLGIELPISSTLSGPDHLAGMDGMLHGAGSS